MMRGSLAELEAVLAVASPRRVSRGGSRAWDLVVLAQPADRLRWRRAWRQAVQPARPAAWSFQLRESSSWRVGSALEAIRSALEHVDEHGRKQTGTLRINTSVGATRIILTPLILEYMRRNPQMTVRS